MKERIEELFSEEVINKRISELGKQISEDYAGKELRLVCVLRGASMFFCELAKRITIPVTFDFISVSSYGDSTNSGDVIHIRKELDDPIEGKYVLLVEDIVDTGRTLSKLITVLEKRGAKSVKLAALLDKKARREIDINADYTGFTVDDGFIIGYGLDYAQKYRNLPYIGILHFE